MLAQFGLFFGGGARDDRNPLGFIGVIAAALFAPFAAMLIQMMISRTREYAADRAGAEICGDPLALASALRRIAGGGKARVMESAERDPATAHMFIVNPLAGRGADNLFSTHPATANRIAALEAMARETGRPGAGHRAAPAGWNPLSTEEETVDAGAEDPSRPGPVRQAATRIPRSGGRAGPWR